MLLWATICFCINCDALTVHDAFDSFGFCLRSIIQDSSVECELWRFDWSSPLHCWLGISQCTIELMRRIIILSTIAIHQLMQGKATQKVLN